MNLHKDYEKDYNNDDDDDNDFKYEGIMCDLHYMMQLMSDFRSLFLISCQR